jgi:hypothetical protein
MGDLKIEATFLGEGFQGNYLFSDVKGDLTRDHLWLNMQRSGFPGQDIPHGSRVRFYCSMFSRGRKPARYTDIREVSII